MANIPPMMPDRSPAIMPVYQVILMRILFEKKRKYMLSANKTIPSISVSVELAWLLINVTAKNIPVKLPIRGNMMFFQFTYFSIVTTTKIDVNAPSMEDSIFASVNINRYGRNIIEKIPKPNPVTLCIKLPHIAIAAISIN